MRYFKILFILFIIYLNININFSYSQVNYFITSNGEWNSLSSWNLGRLPIYSDYAFIGNYENQVCVSQIGSIAAETIQIGSNTTQSTFTLSYGVNTTKFILVNGTVNFNINSPSSSINDKYYVAINETTSNGKINISGYFNSTAYIILEPSSVQNVNNAFYKVLWLQNRQSTTIMKNSNITTEILSGLSSSFVEFENCNIKNDDNITLWASFFEDSSILNIKNSIFNISNYFYFYNNSTFNIINSVGSFLYSKNEKIQPLIGIRVYDNSTINIKNSTLYSEKYFSNINGIFNIDHSNITFINDFYLLNSSKITFSNYSNIVFDAKIWVQQNSIFNILLNSNVTILGWFTGNQNGKTILSNSYLNIIDEKYPNGTSVRDMMYFEFYNNSTFFSKSSTIKSESLFLCFQDSEFNIETTNLYIKNISQFTENAKMVSNQSSIYLDNQLSMHDSSKLSINNTNLYVNSFLIFYHSSSMFSNLTYIFINKYVAIDAFASSLSVSSLYNINGFLYILGKFETYNTELNLNNEILNNGTFNFNQSTLTLYNGNLTNLHQFNSLNSIINVDNGQFYTYGNFSTYNTFLNLSKEIFNYGYFNFNKSYLTIKSGSLTNFNEFESINSKINIENGNFIMNGSQLISINSIITILNGTFVMDMNSIVLISNSKILNNNGELNINGDILFDDNSNLQNIAHLTINSNILTTLNDSETQYLTNQGRISIINNGNGNNITNINIPLLNNGGLIEISKETIMYSLNQINGSSLSMLSTNSNLIIKNNLNMTENDSVVFKIDNTSSIINVEKDATINNSTLIVKISLETLNTDRNVTIMNYSNLTGSGFNTFKFKTYDPNTGKESDIDDCTNVDVLHSQTSLSVMVSNNNLCKKTTTSSGLNNGAKIGIAVGIFGFVLLIGAFIFFKKPIQMKLKIAKHKYKGKKMSVYSE